MTRHHLPAGNSLMHPGFDVTPILGVPVVFDPLLLDIPIGEARVVCDRKYHERDTRWTCVVQRPDGRVTATGFLNRDGAIQWGQARADLVSLVPE